MPAYFDTGFSVRQPMWHGLGIVLPDYPGRDEAMRLAGHSWNALERKLFIVPNGSNKLVEVEGWKGIVRSDTGVFLSAVKDTYEVVQNSVLWDLADTIVAEPSVKYETAGVLKDGRVLWVLVCLNEPITIPGDNSPILPYLRVSTTHDGTAALKAITSSVRTVCWNTFSAGDAESERTGTSFTFRHTKNVKDHIEDARAALGFARGQFGAFIELATGLAAHVVTPQGVDQFVTQFLPYPIAEGAMTDRIKDNIDTNRSEVYKILGGPTVADDHRLTSYGLFNAGIEFLDHVRAFRSSETYFERAFSNNGALKTKLAKLALVVD